MLIQRGAAQQRQRSGCHSFEVSPIPEVRSPPCACVRVGPHRSRDELRDLRSEVLTCGLRAGLGPGAHVVPEGGTDSVHTIL